MASTQVVININCGCGKQFHSSQFMSATQALEAAKAHSEDTGHSLDVLGRVIAASQLEKPTGWPSKQVATRYEHRDYRD